jgi:uncharacterized metal-binding protein YceD (DUF177 family)
MKLTLTVSQIPEGLSEVSWDLSKALFTAIGADYGIEAVSGRVRVRLHRDSAFLRLHLVVEGEVTVPCDRCLQVIQLPITTAHEQVYALTQRHVPPADAEEFYVLGAREDRIDLTQAVYDYLCLAVPSKRVRPTCPDSACPPHIQTIIRPESPHH